MKIQSPDRIVIAEKKRKEIRIAVDLDGVVSFWIKSGCEIFNIDMEDEDIRKKLKETRGKLEDVMGISDDEVWEKVDEAGVKFWSDMELLPWAKRLWEEMGKKSDMVCFLSSPSNNPICAQGKLEWIKKHFDTKNFIITPKKEFCATPQTLLIDDYKKKIKKFEDAGGYGFLWPDPLTLLDEKDLLEETFKKLHKKIDEIKG